MKRLLLLHIILFSTIIVFGQAPVFEWAKQMGGASQDLGYSITVDGTGNVYTTGSFVGTVDFDPGVGVYNLTSLSSKSVFVSKLDGAGNFIWAKKMGSISASSGGAFAEAITLDISGNVFIAGIFWATVDFDPGSGTNNLTSCSFPSTSFADGFILKLDASGNFILARQLKAYYSEIRIHSIAIDNFGDVYTTGSIKDSVDFDPGIGSYVLEAGFGIFVLKLNNLGNFLWAKKMGGNIPTHTDSGQSLALDAANNVYVAGYFGDIEDFDPGTGTFYLASTYRNGFISKLDPLGNLLWAKKIGNDTGDVFALSIAIDNSDNIYTTGYFSGPQDFDPGIGVYSMSDYGNYDIFIEKLDPAGNFVWAKGVGSSGQDYSASIAVDIIGDIYTTGFFQDTADFDPSAGVYNLISTTSSSGYLYKLNASGDFVWAEHIDGPSYGGSITVDANGSVYSTGYFATIIDYDPGIGVSNLSCNGINDIFVHKMNQQYFGIIEHNSNNSIFLYPNPTTNNFTIETTKPTYISIVNLLGQELFNSKIEKSQTIDVSFLSNGIYFVKDLQNGGSIKFIKQ